MRVCISTTYRIIEWSVNLIWEGPSYLPSGALMIAARHPKESVYGLLRIVRRLFSVAAKLSRYHSSAQRQQQSERCQWQFGLLSETLAPGQVEYKERWLDPGWQGDITTHPTSHLEFAWGLRARNNNRKCFLTQTLTDSDLYLHTASFPISKGMRVCMRKEGQWEVGGLSFFIYLSLHLVWIFRSSILKY